MFLTLHRYIFRELLRIFFLATVALTLILSLGSILRPIQEYGVGPQQVIRLLIYFTPVMLTFVIPIAALFAATLTYGRLAGDNEIDACRASGISPMTLVYPGFVLALLVAMANLALSFHVMPRYVRKAERAIKADAKQILFRNLQRKGYYSLPGQRFTVYADNANPEESFLSGVVVLSKRQGVVDTLFVTDDAHVVFETIDDVTEVQIAARNIKEIGQGSGTWFGTDRISVTHRFASLLEDRINFKRVHELKQIQADPLSFPPIGNASRATAERFLRECLLQDVNDLFAQGRGYYTLTGESNTVRLMAGQVVLGSETVDLIKGLEVLVASPAGGKEQRLRCERGTLRLDTRGQPPTLTLTLENVSSDDRLSITMRRAIPNLRLPPTVADAAKTQDQITRLTKAELFAPLRNGASDLLDQDYTRFTRAYRGTLAEIQSEVHSRLVFGLGCIPMILIGIAQGIIKRGGHALSAFGASCVPALILIVGIAGGKELAENVKSQGSPTGIGLIWSGLVVLCFVWFAVYRRLFRN